MIMTCLTSKAPARRSRRAAPIRPHGAARLRHPSDRRGPFGGRCTGGWEFQETHIRHPPDTKHRAASCPGWAHATPGRRGLSPKPRTTFGRHTASPRRPPGGGRARPEPLCGCSGPGCGGVAVRRFIAARFIPKATDGLWAARGPSRLATVPGQCREDPR